MSVERIEGYLPATFRVVGTPGIEFCREDDGSVCVEVEYDDSTWAGPHTGHRYITISAEDWATLVKVIGALPLTSPRPSRPATPHQPDPQPTARKPRTTTT